MTLPGIDRTGRRIGMLGSVMCEIHATRLGNAAVSLPVEAREAARDSISAAVKLAASLPREDALALSAAAKPAFTDALSAPG